MRFLPGMQTIVVAALFMGCAGAQANPPKEFKGWEGMRVAKMDRGELLIGDLSGKGRDSMVLVNRNQSRLDVYEWLEPAARKALKIDPEQPNKLPLAPELGKTEIALDRPPADVTLADINGDGAREIIVQTMRTDEILVFAKKGDKFEKISTGKLVKDKFSGVPLMVLPKGGKDGKAVVLVSSERGVQRLALRDGATAEWVEPRERNLKREWWWSADANGDGIDDILEMAGSERSMNLRQIILDGKGGIEPARLLSDEEFNDLELIHVDGKPCFLGIARGKVAVNLYRIGQDEKASRFGSSANLPVNTPGAELGSSVRIGAQRGYVQLDPAQPLMHFCLLEKGTWQAVASFPVIKDLVRIQAAGDGVLLMQTKNAQALYISRWDGKRWSFPAVYAPEGQNAADDSRIVGMGNAAGTTWWVRIAGRELELWTWASDAAAPAKASMPGFLDEKGLGSSPSPLKADAIDKVNWLGAQRLIVKRSFQPDLYSVTVADQERSIKPLAHLKGEDPASFTQIPDHTGKTELARLSDGVITLVDDALQPKDQVVLPNDLKIRSFCRIAGELLVLELSGKTIHKLEPDASGILRSTTSWEVEPARSLEADPVLGLITRNDEVLRVLSEGRRAKLEMLSSVDRSDMEEEADAASITLFKADDFTGDGRQDMLVVDGRTHKLHLFELKGDKFERRLMWRVFDDSKYPYSDGGRGGSDNPEPSFAAAADLDGDGFPELILQSQDRTIIYVGRENKQ